MPPDSWKFSWPEPMSAFDDAGPRLARGQTHLEIVDGVMFEVCATDFFGVTTGRTRYRVSCQACRVLLHEATTGPGSWILGHLREKHQP